MANRESKVTQRLRKQLREVFDDDEFVDGMLVYAKREEERKCLSDFIDRGKDVSVSTVTALAINLCKRRNRGLD